MATFLVTWDIHIEADTPEEAAQFALKIQRDSNSTATVFCVNPDENGVGIVVDLGPGDCNG